MATILFEAKYIKTDMDANNNKYWYAAVLDDGTYMQENARVGAANPQRRSENLGVSAAEAKFRKKCKEKESGDYVLAKVLNGSSSAKSETVAKSTLESIAVKQIDTNSPETIELIKKITKANVHDIVSATTLKYDESSGDFRTPLGIVTQDGLDEARTTLDQVSILLDQRMSFDDSKFKKLVNGYMNIIPQNVGSKQNSRFGISDIFPDIEAVQKQSSIIDALSASLQKVITSVPVVPGISTDEVKVFSVKMHLVSDGATFDRINKKFKSTLNSVHSSSALKLKRVFTIEIEHMKSAFDKHGKRLGNIKELWHGTRTANLLSILKGGLIIPKSGASHVTGRMFGDGVYFSDQSTKSLNYSQGYWSGNSRDNNCYMFLSDVAMGKEYVPSGPSQSLPRAGYDSTFAMANKSGVMNNEMIVYNLNQCTLTFLCEFDR